MIKHELFSQPLEIEEVWRVNRAQMALALHKLPAEIDQMPYPDYADLKDVFEANLELSKRRRR